MSIPLYPDQPDPDGGKEREKTRDYPIRKPETPTTPTKDHPLLKALRRLLGV